MDLSVRPLHELGSSLEKRPPGLLFDLDDTFLDQGRLHVAALESLERLTEAGLLAIGVTGRSAAWAHASAHQWPVQAMVAENGGLCVVEKEGHWQLEDPLDAPERAKRQQFLRNLGQKLCRRLPPLKTTQDAFGRISDWTLDIGETQQVSDDIVAEAAAFAEQQGCATVRSSVHLHLSLDRVDKCSGVLSCLQQHFGEESTAALQRFVFIGDSENDSACFAGFRHSVGVSNLRGLHTLPPAFVTKRPSSEGFVELVKLLLSLPTT